MTAPTIPPAALLARLRAEQARLFTDSASITVTAYSSDTTAGTWTDSDGSGTTVACNITPLGEEQRRELFNGQQLAAIASHTIRFPSTATVGSGDEATISAVVYKIVGVNDKRSNALFIEAFAMQVGSS